MSTEVHDLPPWDTPDHVEWPESTEYPSDMAPFHHDYELAESEGEQT